MDNNSANLQSITKSFEAMNRELSRLYTNYFKNIDFSALIESITKPLQEISEAYEKTFMPSASISLESLRKSLEEFSNSIKIDFNPFIDSTVEMLKGYDFQDKISKLESSLPEEVEMEFTDDEIQLVNELDDTLVIGNRAKMDSALIVSIITLLVTILGCIQNYIADKQSSEQMERIIENQEEQLEETKRLESYENRVANLLESISSQLEQSSQE